MKKRWMLTVLTVLFVMLGSVTGFAATVSAAASLEGKVIGVTFSAGTVAFGSEVTMTVKA